MTISDGRLRNIADGHGSVIDDAPGDTMHEGRELAREVLALRARVLAAEQAVVGEGEASPLAREVAGEVVRRIRSVSSCGTCADSTIELDELLPGQDARRCPACGRQLFALRGTIASISPVRPWWRRRFELTCTSCGASKEEDLDVDSVGAPVGLVPCQNLVDEEWCGGDFHAELLSDGPCRSTCAVARMLLAWRQWAAGLLKEPGEVGDELLRKKIAAVVESPSVTEEQAPLVTVTGDVSSERFAEFKRDWKRRVANAANAPSAWATPVVDLLAAERDVRQRRVADWATECFGVVEAGSPPQRGIQLLEEAAEVAQACGVGRDIALSLVAFVFQRPPGMLHQEVGGLSLTLLALAQATGLSADAEERRELDRVLSLPREHFAERNQKKNDAGFRVVPPREEP